MPEGMLGYDADEVVRKANAAKHEKETIVLFNDGEDAAG